VKKIISLLFVWVIGLQAHAQITPKTLSAEEVLLIVKQYHPVVKQAAIAIQKRKAGVLIARSAFDPILSNKMANKTFSGENYYQYANPQISIPTWFGIELVAGLENLSGNRYDPSETIGQSNYAGISVPLLKNLVIDKRRATLQQAKLYHTIAEVEQQVMINDLLMEAMEDYWQWVKAYQTYVIISNNVRNNEQRVELIRKSYANGERPAIDTVEAVAQLQTFQYQQNESWFTFLNAGLTLSVHLWQENNLPFMLSSEVIPPSDWDNEKSIQQFNIQLDDLIQQAENLHPELQIYTTKLDILAIDKKLKFQELLPKVDLSYNALGKGYQIFNKTTAMLENNYQYGLKMEVPLRLSAGRGLYKQAKLNIQDTKYAQSFKKQQITLKVKSYYNQFINIKNQIALQSNNYNLYQKLVLAEETRISNGESSLFVVNSRENKALEVYQKLIELKALYFKTIYAMQWSAGLLYQ
jgi:outer membrane protein TolC